MLCSREISWCYSYIRAGACVCILHTGSEISFIQWKNLLILTERPRLICWNSVWARGPINLIQLSAAGERWLSEIMISRFGELLAAEYNNGQYHPILQKWQFDSISGTELGKKMLLFMTAVKYINLNQVF